MAITQTERIFDLAYGAKYSPEEIASILPVNLQEVRTALANLGSGPSTQTQPTAAAEYSASGVMGLLYANQRQIANSQRPARSNFDYLGLAGAKDEKPTATTKLSSNVPIPVKPGDVFTKVGLVCGETAGGTITHQIAALYEGKGAKPVLLAQSKDTTSAAIAASTINFWELEKTVEVTETNCPNGFIYAQITIVATTIPTCYNQATEAKLSVIGTPIKGTAKETPQFLSATSKAAAEEGIKAEAKLETEVTAAAKAPFVILV